MTKKQQDIILAWQGAYFLANNKKAPRVKEWGNGWFVVDGMISKKLRLSKIERMTETLLKRVQNVQN